MRRGHTLSHSSRTHQTSLCAPQNSRCLRSGASATRVFFLRQGVGDSISSPSRVRETEDTLAYMGEDGEQKKAKQFCDK